MCELCCDTLTRLDLTRVFLHSVLTVVDETKTRRHLQLAFVDFLEALARIAFLRHWPDLPPEASFAHKLYRTIAHLRFHDANAAVRELADLDARKAGIMTTAQAAAEAREQNIEVMQFATKKLSRVAAADVDDGADPMGE